MSATKDVDAAPLLELMPELVALRKQRLSDVGTRFQSGITERMRPIGGGPFDVVQRGFSENGKIFQSRFRRLILPVLSLPSRNVKDRQPIPVPHSVPTAFVPDCLPLAVLRTKTVRYGTVRAVLVLKVDKTRAVLFSALDGTRRTVCRTVQYGRTLW